MEFSFYVDRWRRGLALENLDVGGDRNRLDIFKVLVRGAFRPAQELLDRIHGYMLSWPDASF